MIWTQSALLCRGRVRIVTLTTALALLVVYVLFVTAQVLITRPFNISSSALGGGTESPRLPPPYTQAELTDNSNDTCAKQYDTEYIRNFVQSETSYCDNTSAASLTCFSAESIKSRVDTFCIGGPAKVSVSEGSVDLPCRLRELSFEDRAKHSPPNINRFTNYWYNTGPKIIFSDFIHLGSGQDDVSPQPAAAGKVIFLVKREDTVYNLWHTLMQIMSLTLSLDVLQLTIDPKTGSPFFDDRDVRDSQVMILDQYEEGPFFELWTMFAPLPPLRLGDDLAFDADKVIVPLPGGSNPVWEGDWVDISCNDSSLLKAFSQRILNHYRIPTEKLRRKQPALTLIDRKGSRRLRSSEQLTAALRSSFPDVKVELVDFAEMSFPDQIRLVRSTDILVGVHGAGLTHELFLTQGSTVVEIMPEQLNYKGFANMAKLLGHHYLTRRGAGYDDDSGDWHVDDVSIDEDEFLELIGEAVSKAKG